MNNPFLPDHHPDPYLWNPFRLTKVPRQEWRPARVRYLIDIALRRSRGRQCLSIDGVRVTQPRINEIRHVFSDPCLRLAHELLVHPSHKASPDDFAGPVDQLTELSAECVVPPRRLKLSPAALAELVPSRPVTRPGSLSLPPSSGKIGPRGAEAPVDYGREEVE